MWQDIIDFYISKGAKRGYWRLIVAPRPAPEPVEAPVEAVV